jgi:hypothetical protein
MGDYNRNILINSRIPMRNTNSLSVPGGQFTLSTPQFQHGGHLAQPAPKSRTNPRFDLPATMR